MGRGPIAPNKDARTPKDDEYELNTPSRLLNAANEGTLAPAKDTSPSNLDPTCTDILFPNYVNMVEITPMLVSANAAAAATVIEVVSKSAGQTPAAIFERLSSGCMLLVHTFSQDVNTTTFAGVLTIDRTSSVDHGETGESIAIQLKPVEAMTQ
ncbi:hypothetical protein K437DRAFT_260982 [Tilletiaria anomala UBC 951]|uniref:Uncharacterized protein n=1 Tax=Tilletiaria anomala (strain ATCC 24038 / CBS 436.72 / UBC 951) TaxID=1037660 RepID=A0A066WGS8_TILAU|nr:uncharacterized protein K437DRAFT_260982 [Tilletiaria anomala UBC 951]KDN53006.1 hypothetical protein K437DRAFT_260982 [Tilletiaria anomala UBC 951]